LPPQPVSRRIKVHKGSTSKVEYPVESAIVKV